MQYLHLCEYAWLTRSDDEVNVLTNIAESIIRQNSRSGLKVIYFWYKKWKAKFCGFQYLKMAHFRYQLRSWTQGPYSQSLRKFRSRAEFTGGLRKLYRKITSGLRLIHKAPANKAKFTEILRKFCALDGHLHWTIVKSLLVFFFIWIAEYVGLFMKTFTCICDPWEIK